MKINAREEKIVDALIELFDVADYPFLDMACEDFSLEKNIHNNAVEYVNAIPDHKVDSWLGWKEDGKIFVADTIYGRLIARAFEQEAEVTLDEDNGVWVIKNFDDSVWED